MRGRDFALVVLLLLVGGVAVVDALRDGDTRDARPVVRSPAPAPTPGRQPQPQRVAPDDYPRGVLDGLLIVADARDCQFRIFSLAGGRERFVQPTEPLADPCAVWTSLRGELIAYPTEETSGFQLNYPFIAIGRPVGRALMSPDEERVAWCRAAHSGVEFRAGPDRVHGLRSCPNAYTSSGDTAYILGGRLVSGRRTLLRASGRIDYATWGRDGSIGVVVEGRLERWMNERRADTVEIPDRLALRAPPLFSPDNCAALFRDVDEGWFEVVALDCFETDRPDLLIFGNSRAVAWSPDGRWIAVAYSDRIGFHRARTGEEVASWPARAAALAWTED